MKSCPFCAGSAFHSALPGDPERVHCTSCGVVLFGAGCLEKWDARVSSPVAGKRKPAASLLPANVFEFLPPAFASSGAFVDAWEAYVDRRTKMKGVSCNERAVKLLANKFSQWGVDSSVTALNDSEMNGWRGVFEPKSNGKPVVASKPLLLF